MMGIFCEIPVPNHPKQAETVQAELGACRARQNRVGAGQNRVGAEQNRVGAGQAPGRGAWLCDSGCISGALSAAFSSSQKEPGGRMEPLAHLAEARGTFQTPGEIRGSSQ